jgi:hypothetical protein
MEGFNMLDREHENERYIIFASDETGEYTEKFLHKCGIGFKVLSGRYKGEDETSYIINKKNEHLIQPLVEQQESVLELTETNKKGARHAVLKMTNGTIAMLGDFIAVPQGEAESAEAYTFDPITNQYFIAK